jgi:hypothetical protein
MATINIDNVDYDTEKLSDDGCATSQDWLLMDRFTRGFLI